MTAIHSFLVSLLLLFVGVSCSAETLTTGENVGEFVTRNINNNEVRCENRCVCVLCSKVMSRAPRADRKQPLVLCPFRQVMVFAKSYCPHCQATRALLKTMHSSIDVEISILDLDKMEHEDGALVQMELLQRTGQRTVPNGKCQNS